MEIKSAKFAHNKEFSDCIRGVVPAVLKVVLEKSATVAKDSETLRIMTAAKAQFVAGGWAHGLLRPLLQESVDGVSFIESMEEAALETEEGTCENLWSDLFIPPFFSLALHD